MHRYYVLIRKKNLSHVEAEFSTRAELDEFLQRYKDDIIPHETHIIDREKEREKSNQEFMGKLAMIALGVITLYLMFK